MKPYQLVLRAVIKNDREEFLLMKRSAKCKSFPGYWEFPGGKVNPGEHFTDALVREIAEETGYEIRLLKVIGSAEHDMPQVRSAYLFFMAEITGGKFQISHEHDDFAWLDLVQMKKAKVPPQLKALIDSLA